MRKPVFLTVIPVCLILLSIVALVSSRWKAPVQRGYSAEAVDALMDQALKFWRVPGASVAVVKDGNVVYEKGFGIREAGKTDLVTPDTLFAIGSITKSFTATVMAMLVDEGKLRWGDPVRRHIPFFQLSDPLANRDIALLDLVSHRTGFRDHNLLFFHEPEWSREEIVRRFAIAPHGQSFRSSFNYNNVQYMTAGYAAGRAAGMTWEELVQARILDPLGMETANFSVKAMAKSPNHAKPHGGSGILPYRNLDREGPAGSINASAREMSKWVQFHLSDGTHEGNRLLSAERMKELHTPLVVVPLHRGSYRSYFPASEIVTYGLGWLIHDYRGHHVVAHGGNIDGFRSWLVMVPKENVGFVVLANTESYMPVAVSYSLLDLLLELPPRDWNTFYRNPKKASGQPQVARKQEKPVEKKKMSLELDAYAGVYEQPAYDRIEIVLEDDALVFKWGERTNSMEHADGDAFKVIEPNQYVPADYHKVMFKVGKDGTVSRMTALGVEFKRVK